MSQDIFKAQRVIIKFNAKLYYLLNSISITDVKADLTTVYSRNNEKVLLDLDK